MTNTPLNPDGVLNAMDTLMAETDADARATEWARKVTTRVLEGYFAAALPEVTSDVYTVAIKNTQKSTGHVFFDYPGCAPEIGTLDNARELLNWVNEGTPSSPDSPYSSESRIYKLTEVNDA